MIRIGTVGTGFVVDAFAQAVRDTGKLEIAAVYSRTRETADAFADKHGVAKRYCDRGAFLNDAELDFIYVASPNSLHYEWTRDALKAGRNVLCEKPFVSTERELCELVSLAAEKGLFLFEAITVPHLPNYKLLKEHIDEIGPVTTAQLNFSQYSSRYDKFLAGEQPNVFNPEFSGGALMDINYYNLNFLLGLFGVPREARYFPNLAQNGIDTSGAAVLRYDGLVCCAVGCKDSKSKNLAQLQGAKGYIVVPEESSRCISFTVYTKQGQTEYNVQDNGNAIYYELLDFIEIYEKKDFARRDELLEHSLLVTRVVEALRKDGGVRFPADEVG